MKVVPDSTTKHDLDHFLNTLRAKYKISTDLTGFNYIGFTIDWNYNERYVDVSMKNYIYKIVRDFIHVPPTRKQHSLHKWTEPVYGWKVQYRIPLSFNPSMRRFYTIPEL